MELLDHMVVLFLTWWGTSRLFSIMTAPMYIPKNSVENSLLSISSPTLVISLFKNYFWLKDNGFTILHWFLTYININQSFVHMTAILTGVKWYITVICIGISLKINDVQAPSCVPFGHLYVSFGKMSTQFFCPFLNWIFFFSFCYWVVWVLWILTRCWILYTILTGEEEKQHLGENKQLLGKINGLLRE